MREVATRERALRLDTDDATVLSPARSLFRVDAGRRGTEVYVLSGQVDVNGRGGRALVRAGEYAYVDGDAEIEVEVAAAPRDRFARFLEERRDRADRRDVTRYVGSEYSYDSDAAAFEDNGTWVYVPSVGAYCWRPNVAPGWTPYSLGTWRWTPAGLTWVSYESWGWLPYHYGTWAWDPDLGWYWIPGNLYAPAWVYWSYADDWTGWCPVGWYGGYYDSYYRSTRPTYGNERGGPWLPNLRGKVEVTQIDRRGWNFAPTPRIGSRLERRDVTRGDRVPFPRGRTVVVTTAPLRVERGAGPATSVPDAIRRASLSPESARGPVNEGFTAILRRDRVLDAAGREELRRSLRPSREFGGRVSPVEASRPPGREDSWRAAGTGNTRGDAPLVRDGRARSDEGWRASTTVLPAPVERRRGESRERQGDSGWRAPSPRRDRALDGAPRVPSGRRAGPALVSAARTRGAAGRSGAARIRPVRPVPRPVGAGPSGPGLLGSRALRSSAAGRGARTRPGAAGGRAATADGRPRPRRLYNPAVGVTLVGSRLLRALFILYVLEAGAFLSLAPWSRLWSLRVVARSPAIVRGLLASPYFRSFLVGVGLLHLWAAVAEIEAWRREPRPEAGGLP